jgi:hypothetical protein
MNVYFGDLASFDQLIGVKEGVIGDPPEEAYKPWRGQFTRWAQHVRRAPSRNGEHVRFLTWRQQVTVYEEFAGWGRIGEDEWTWLGNIRKVEADCLFEAECRAWALTIRTEPVKKDDNDVGYLLKGQRVKVYEVKQNWGRIDEDKWVHLGWMRKL